MRVLFIFAAIVLASVLTACSIYDVRLEGGSVNFYQKATAPTLPSGSSFMTTVGRTRQPVGHYEYCRTYVTDCAIVSNDTRPTALTRERWAELVEVNDKVNRKVRPHPKDEDGQSTDLLVYGVGEHWTYPVGYGDCEDVVLAKRLLLMKRGWPASSLVITLAYLPKGGGHAVLTVRTDRGDYILDNLNGRILAWTETSYRFFKRQSEFDSGKWRGVIDVRDLTPVVAKTN